MIYQRLLKFVIRAESSPKGAAHRQTARKGWRFGKLEQLKEVILTWQA